MHGIDLGALIQRANVGLAQMEDFVVGLVAGKMRKLDMSLTLHGETSGRN